MSLCFPAVHSLPQLSCVPMSESATSMFTCSVVGEYSSWLQLLELLMNKASMKILEHILMGSNASILLAT